MEINVVAGGNAVGNDTKISLPLANDNTVSFCLSFISVYQCLSATVKADSTLILYVRIYSDPDICEILII